ncbi:MULTISPECIES: hypothetical protein [unclassified Streptomyces]|uniref:hypothetical protein n=1 Tax=unclassified Streptomyces TaxID=2593676 RepID=UPI00381B239F
MAVRAVRGAVRRDLGGAGHPCEQGGEPLAGLPVRGAPVTGGPLGPLPTAVPGRPGGRPAAVRTTGAGPAAARAAGARTAAARTIGVRTIGVRTIGVRTTGAAPPVPARAPRAERLTPPAARPLARVGADLPKPRTAPARPGAATALRKDITP